MSHHSQSLPDFMKEAVKELNLGATGDFPDGKLDESDEGGIKFAIVGDTERGLVHLNFGKPVSYVSMSVVEAIAIAQGLIRHARGVSKVPLRISIT